MVNELVEFQRSHAIKIGPDKPLEHIRYLTLELSILFLTYWIKFIDIIFIFIFHLYIIYSCPIMHTFWYNDCKFYYYILNFHFNEILLINLICIKTGFTILSWCFYLHAFIHFKSMCIYIKRYFVYFPESVDISKT